MLRRIRASGKCQKHSGSDCHLLGFARRSEAAAKLGAGYFRKPVTYDEFMKIGPFLRRFLEDNGLIEKTGQAAS